MVGDVDKFVDERLLVFDFRTTDEQDYGMGGVFEDFGQVFDFFFD